MHLENELKELKEVIEQVVRDHPALASKFSFLENASNSTAAVPRDQPLARNGSKEPALATPLAIEDERVSDEQQAADTVKDEGEDDVVDQKTHGQNDLTEQHQPKEPHPVGVHDQADRHRTKEADRVDKDEKQGPVVHTEELKTDPIRQRLEKLQGVDDELQHVPQVPKTPPAHRPDAEAVQKETENKAQGDSRETVYQNLQELFNDAELRDILNEP